MAKYKRIKSDKKVKPAVRIPTPPKGGPMKSKKTYSRQNKHRGITNDGKNNEEDIKEETD